MLTSCGGPLNVFLPYYYTWGISHTTIVLVFFISDYFSDYLLCCYSLLCITDFFSCGCEVLMSIVSLIYLNEVAKSCPIPKASCPRSKKFLVFSFCSFCKMLFSCSNNAENLLMQKWRTSCSGDGVCGRQIPTQTTLKCVFLQYDVLSAGIPWRHELWPHYTWRAFPQRLKAQGGCSIPNVSHLQPVLIIVFKASKLIAA